VVEVPCMSRFVGGYPLLLVFLVSCWQFLHPAVACMCQLVDWPSLSFMSVLLSPAIARWLLISAATVSAMAVLSHCVRRHVGTLEGGGYMLLDTPQQCMSVLVTSPVGCMDSSIPYWSQLSWVSPMSWVVWGTILCCAALGV
jgi:hypothetical protein